MCCKEYKVRLTAYEYLKLKWTGFVEEKNGRFYIRKINGRCPFQLDKLCTLQNRMKPLACKLYPFVVLGKGDEEALYEYAGEEYYVYVEVFCPNLKLRKRGEKNLTRSPKIMEMVREAISLYRNEGKFELLTSPIKYVTPPATDFRLP
jgi:hypothetical protein